MRLSWHTDYSLRVLMYLAEKGARATVGEVSEFFSISKDHVAKVVQHLVRLGYLRSVRGIGGGLELARSTETITIADVIRDVEGNVHLLECVAAEQQVCVIQPHCKLKVVLLEAERVQMEYLNSVRLCDVVKPKSEPQLVSVTAQ